MNIIYTENEISKTRIKYALNKAYGANMDDISWNVPHSPHKDGAKKHLITVTHLVVDDFKDVLPGFMHEYTFFSDKEFEPFYIDSELRDVCDEKFAEKKCASTCVSTSWR